MAAESTWPPLISSYYYLAAFSPFSSCTQRRPCSIYLFTNRFCDVVKSNVERAAWRQQSQSCQKPERLFLFGAPWIAVPATKVYQKYETQLTLFRDPAWVVHGVYTLSVYFLRTQFTPSPQLLRMTNGNGGVGVKKYSVNSCRFWLCFSEPKCSSAQL